MHQHFLQQTIELAVNNVAEGGGPFAAILVKEQQIIAVGVNKVTANHDPTAHAEIQAIRIACQLLKNFELTEYTLYSSCEPCPMCLGAIYWARLAAVYFACGRGDAAQAGFDDTLIYDEIIKPPAQRIIEMRQIQLADAVSPFQAWNKLESKIRY